MAEPPVTGRALAFTRSKRWESDTHKLVTYFTWLESLEAMILFALREAELTHRDPPARPPKARTEWGMVHRERCVHRMGN